MSLHHRWMLALGMLFLSCAALAEGRAQEPIQGTTLTSNETRLKESLQLKDPLPFSKLVARKTPEVAAVERVKGAVVNIHSERVQNGADTFPMSGSPSRVNGMGTGIIIDPRGYIVTNQHVVDDVSALRIRLSDGTTQSAIVVARHPELDLALIKIEPPYPLPVMPMGTAADLMVGERVIAIGNAFGYEHTVSVGIVSAIKRDVSLNKEMSYKSLIQTDASINPGNSGGPLVNIHGDLVGVNVAIRAGAHGIGFAIPVDHMVRSVSEMLKMRRRSLAYDGLGSRDVLVPGQDGLVRKVVVERVEVASPADAAGLRVGDVLLQIGEVRVESGIDVERGLLERRAGDNVTFVVKRQDQEQRFQLAMGSADRQQRAAPISDIVWQKLGIHLVPVNGDLVTRVNNQLHGGLEVTTINSNGLAYRAGIRKGDILVGLHKWETVNMENVTYVLNHPDVATINAIPFFIVRSGQMRSGQLTSVP